MTQLNAALAIIGLTVVLLALFSKPIKRSLIQEPMIAVAVGIAAGPYGLGWLDVAEWGKESRILEQAAQFTLAIGLMGVALRLKKESVTALWRLSCCSSRWECWSCGWRHRPLWLGFSGYRSG